jgi:hypothetical protein
MFDIDSMFQKFTQNFTEIQIDKHTDTKDYYIFIYLNFFKWW